MSFWTEIVNHAVIGTERQAFAPPAAEGALQALLAQLDYADREAALLKAAALAALRERAGRLPHANAQPLPAPAEAETAPRCSAPAAHHLKLMLQGEHRELLPEWLAALTAAGKRIPAEQLVALLNLGKADEEARAALLPALGARGRWLAAQNSDWDYALGVNGDAGLWETGSRAQRRAFLQSLRQRDATRARELLQATWAQEPSQERADLLAALQVGLSLDDEALLENALDDKHKEVRKAAADLLGQLPESAFCQRMSERARARLAYKTRALGKDYIEVAPPTACDKAMQRDGIEPKPPAYSGINEKAWWLQQTLACVPPSMWSRAFAKTPRELLQAIKRNEWKEALLSGWAGAAQRFADAEWAKALLMEKAVRPCDAFGAMPPGEREAFLVELLRDNPDLAIGDLAQEYFPACATPWSEALSHAALDHAFSYAQQHEAQNDWWLGSYFGILARQLAPALIRATIERITQTSSPHERHPAYARLLNLLQFRHDMLKELQP
jgi:hypothetical protein